MRPTTPHTDDKIVDPLHSIYYTTCVNANEGDPGHPARIATPTLCCQTRRKLGWWHDIHLFHNFH